MLIKISQMLKQQIPSETWYFDIPPIAINLDYVIHIQCCEVEPFQIYEVYMANGSSIFIDEDTFLRLISKSK